MYDPQPAPEGELLSIVDFHINFHGPIMHNRASQSFQHAAHAARPAIRMHAIEMRLFQSVRINRSARPRLQFRGISGMINMPVRQ